MIRGIPLAAAFLAGLVWLAAVPMTAQQPVAAPPPFKGVWEPVSFSEDLDFREVFFVTIDKGWVAGSKGTIIHTKDGGATWTAQLGGDPQAAEQKVTLLRFLDETHGWAGDRARPGKRRAGGERSQSDGREAGQGAGAPAEAVC